MELDWIGFLLFWCLDWFGLLLFNFGVWMDGFLSFLGLDWIGLLYGFFFFSCQNRCIWGKQTGVTTNKQRSKGGVVGAVHAMPMKNEYGAFWRWGLGGTFFLGHNGVYTGSVWDGIGWGGRLL